MAKLGVRTVDELVGRTDLIKAGKMAEEYNVDLSRIIDNPFANDAQSKISYANKNPYNFELEKTVDETVLMKKLGPALEKKQRLRRNMEQLWMRIHLLSNATAAVDRVSVHLSRRDSHWNWLATATIISVRDFPVVRSSSTHRMVSAMMHPRISSSEMLHSMEQLPVRHSSTVLPVSVLLFVTPVQRQLWRASASMAAST